MMEILNKVWHVSQNIEKQFKHKAVLAIPSESYEAPVITVMQGLQELGFTVYVLNKPNINTWFVNTIIDNPRKVRFDFVLWGLHWGTRWGHYEKYGLQNRLNVLIDGCDNRAKHSWQDKYEFYCYKYKGRFRPQEPILSRDLQPHRWMEPLGRFKPDIVFTSQKNPSDKTIYLPFGIHREALQFKGNGKIGRERKIDFTNIPGPGDARGRLTRFIEENGLFGRVHNSKVKGAPVIPKEIEKFVIRDNNIHSYFRWVLHRDYFRVLNDTKVFIYPNVYDRAHWDSKKIWEAYASGCLCLLEKPRVDMSEYPVTELCEVAQFKDYDELVHKARWLYHNQGRLEQLRLQTVEGALKYFNATQIARYFLWRVLSEQKGTK